MFIIDKSGSMYNDNKWNQAINATMYALNDLNLNNDRVGIILFDSNIKSLKIKTINEYIINTEIKKFIFDQGIETNKKGQGGTDINKALLNGIDLIKKDIIFNQTHFFMNQIILITDGSPTVGVTNTDKILENVGNANKNKDISIFGLGIGQDTGTSWVYDLNYPFIRALLDNNGFTLITEKSEDLILLISIVM